MQDSKRALRRHYKNLKINKARDVLKNNWHIKNPSDKMVARHADNLAICSCSMCGNPRKFFNEKTIQEKRAHYVEEVSGK